ncbi:MAG: serine protease [Treponema sp.]|jgi:serine protease Do|nr:serine protease [Treponema sp.]
MTKKILCSMLLFVGAGLYGFGQELRDFVCLINQTYHPDIIAYMGKLKAEFEKRAMGDAAKSVDNYLKGGFGSGFIYVDSNGDNYIITNNHVVNQAYTITITFEKLDGTKLKYENLTILAVDEVTDIAILAFPPGERPFTSGFSVLNRPIREGEDVFSAGFPSLSGIPVWQFGRGMVSNASVMVPIGDDPEENIGPYIQHTAQVDPGNSGGPLLVADQQAPTGYVVAGINTLSFRSRQAANYSIQIKNVLEFAGHILSGKGSGQEEFDKRIESFLAGLSRNRAVYGHIAKYLSNECTAMNAEFALSDMLEKAPRSVQEEIITVFVRDPVSGMGEAVAWIIENSLRARSGVIRASLQDVSRQDDGSYKVNFTIQDKTIESTWVKEYNIWRIRTFGDAALDDRTQIEAKTKKREQNAGLRTDIVFAVNGGFEYLFDRGPAFFMSAWYQFVGPVFWDVQFHFAGMDYIHIETGLGFNVPIKLNSFAISPFAIVHAGFKKIPPPPNNQYITGDLAYGWSARGGLQVVIAAVPGLLFQAAYQYNSYIAMEDQIELKEGKHGVTVGIGYVF